MKCTEFERLLLTVALVTFGVRGEPSSEGPFIEEPEDIWVVKSEPVKIYCTARDVIKVAFYCDGIPVSSKFQSTTPDLDGVTKSFITLLREEIVSQSGEMLINQCYCSVWIGVDNVKQSRVANIRIASLKKEFMSSPVSKRVSVGSPVELQCRPPEGEPLPKVHWMKDGVPISQQVPGSSSQSNPAFSGSRFIVGEQYPTLMITEAAFADTGEYVCVAENVFARRESYAAKLDVYENGGWSSWSKWSECSSECGKGTLTRTRTCSNPPPVNGSPCSGKANETADCTIVCQESTNDGWGEWGSWSPCNQQCTQVRHRDCNLSSAQNGVPLPCPGKPVEQRNCSGDYCTFISLGTAPPFKGSNYPSNKANRDSNLALYFGLMTIVGLFIIVVLLIVFFIQRRSKYGLICSQNSPQHLNYMSHEPYHHHPEALAMSGKYREAPQYPAHYSMVTSYQPNPFGMSSGTLTNASSTPHPAGFHPGVNFANGGLVSPITSCNAPIPSAQISNGSTVPVGNFFLMPAAQYGLFQGDLVPASKLTSAESPKNYRIQAGNEKGGYSLGVQIGSGNPAFLPLVGTNGERASVLLDHYEDLPEDIPLALAQEYQMKALQNNPMMAANLAEFAINIEPHCIAQGKVGFAGGRLCIPDSKVSLLIPEGAIPRGMMQDVYIAVCRDERQIPKLSDKQQKTTLLSPVVFAGPPGLKFQKPVILTFEHAARGSTFDWSLKVLTGANWSETISVNESSMSKTGSPNNNNLSTGSNSDLFCQVDYTTSYLMGDLLRGQYALIGGQQTAATLVIKSLKCVAFSCLPPTTKNSPLGSCPQEVTVRIYCIPNFRDSWEYVNEVEKQFGGTLVSNCVDFDFVSYNEPLKLALGEVSPGWTTKCSQQEIPFDHIWDKVVCHNQHASFSLARLPQQQKDLSLESLSFHIKVTQGSFSHNFKNLAIKLNPDYLMTVANNAANMLEHFNDRHADSDTDTSRNVSSESPASMFVFRLSPQIRRQMIETFDKNHGKNWYHLAAMLKLDQFQTYFATKSSPTEHLLDLWEARHRDRNSIAQLVDILKSLGQFETSALIERELSEWL